MKIDVVDVVVGVVFLAIVGSAVAAMLAYAIATIDNVRNRDAFLADCSRVYAPMVCRLQWAQSNGG